MSSWRSCDSRSASSIFQRRQKSVRCTPDIMEAYRRWYSDDQTGAFYVLDAAVPTSLRADLTGVDVSLAVKHVLAGESLLKFWRYTYLPVTPKWRRFQVLASDGKYFLSWDSRNRRRRKYHEDTLNIGDIAAIRSGAESTYLRRKGFEENAIEIMYKQNHFLRICCPNSLSWKYWLIGLLTLRERAYEKVKDYHVSNAVYALWEGLSRDAESQLTTLDSIIALLRDLEINCDVRYLRLLCKDPSAVEYLEFEKLMGRLLTVRELLETFHKAARQKSHMTDGELLDFLRDVQLERAPARTVNLLLDAVPPQLRVPNGLSDVGFCRALMSTRNTIWRPDVLAKDLYPLNLPASRYWIKTAYNPCFNHPWCVLNPLTKLRKCLLQGYRSLVFDVYESADGILSIPSSAKPPKYIPAEKVFRLCKEYAFKQHHTPVFIFLSVDVSLSHCVELGRKLTDVFGKDLLVLSEMAKELGDKSEGKLDWDFRLNDFRDRFIVGGKRVNLPCPSDRTLNAHTHLRHLELQNDDLKLEELFAPAQKFDLVSGISDTGYQAKPSFRSVNNSLESPDRRSARALPSRTDSERSLRRTGQSHVGNRTYGLLALELRQYVEAIVLLEQSAHKEFTGDRNSAEISLDYRAVLCCSPDDYDSLGNLRKDTLYKVAPLSLLSNVTPIPALDGWSRGYQMIAHFAGQGRPEWIQRGRFLENGNCGYILRQTSPAAATVPPRQRELTIRVLAGRQVPSDGRQQNFVVSVILFRGCAAAIERQTRVVASSGLDPRWNDSLSFEVGLQDFLPEEEDVTTASAAMLVFDVKQVQQDHSQSMCGTAIPLRCLNTGLRWVPLWSLNGEDIKWAGLLVHTETRYIKSAPEAAAPLSRRNSAKEMIIEQRRQRRQSAAGLNAALKQLN